jgi:hypothetical protein
MTSQIVDFKSVACHWANDFGAAKKKNHLTQTHTQTPNRPDDKARTDCAVRTF